MHCHQDGLQTCLYYFVYGTLFMINLKKVTCTQLADTKVILTLHTYRRTWNEAEALCRSQNQVLFIEDSHERSNVLTKFRSEEWSSDNEEVWIGLHFPISEPSTIFGWTTCLVQNMSEYNHWKTSEPRTPDKRRCVVSDRTQDNWRTKSCHYDRSFICEERAEECTFRGHGNRTAPLPSVHISNSDAIGCQQECLTHMTDNLNCWAFAYDASLNECYLFHTDDPFYFDTESNIQISSAYTLFVKECYEAFVDTTDDSIGLVDTDGDSSNSNGNDDDSPTEGCVNFGIHGSSPAIEVTPLLQPSFSSTTVAVTMQMSTPTNTITENQSTSLHASHLFSQTCPVQTVTVTPIITKDSLTSREAISSSPLFSQTRPVQSVTLTPTKTQDGFTSKETLSSSNSDKDICSCGCSDLSSILNVPKSARNMTVEEQLEEIVKNLTVDTSKLSSTIRKKTSAKDDRPSSTSIGTVGVAMLAFTFGLLVVFDAINFCTYMNRRFRMRKILK